MARPRRARRDDLWQARLGEDLQRSLDGDVGDPGLAVDPSVGIDAALLFRPHPGQFDRGVLLQSRLRKQVDIDGNPAGIEQVQSLLLIRQVLHDETEDDFDRNARAEQRDREYDDAPHSDRVGRMAASRLANTPLGESVFHCCQPPAFGARLKRLAAVVAVIFAQGLRRARSPRSGSGR